MKLDRIAVLFILVFIPFSLFGAPQPAISTALRIMPLPGSDRIPQRHTVLLRSEVPLGRQTPDRIEVRGEHSGIHSGSIVLSQDRCTAIFKPDRSYALGEWVHVRVPRGLLLANGESSDPVEWRFRVMEQPPPVENLDDENMRTPEAVESDYHEYRGVAFPSDISDFTVTTTGGQTPGFLVMGLTTGALGSNMLLEMDTQGEITFYRYFGATRILNFQVHEKLKCYTYYTHAIHGYVILDSTYQPVDTLKLDTEVYDRGPDIHEIVQLEEGGFWAIVNFYHKEVDLTEYGGLKNATVVSGILVHVDGTGEVVWEWRSWDYIDISETVNESLRSSKVDYVHFNSIEFMGDSAIVVSARSLDQILKIDLATGDILWRFGGVRNDFTVDGGKPTHKRQHDARILPNGHLLFFDNGPYASGPTRILEYELNESDSSATTAWSYTQPNASSVYMGNSQRLDNGNTVVGWGVNNAGYIASEINPAGDILFDFDVSNTGIYSYRAYYSSWHGTHPFPELTVDFDPSGFPRLFFAHFDDRVVSYNIWAAGDDSVFVLLDTTDQTQYLLDDLGGLQVRYVKVNSALSDGSQSEFSKTLEFDQLLAVNEPVSSNSDAAANLISWPNPANAGFSATWSQPAAGTVELEVYNLLGRRVARLASGRYASGVHTVHWNSGNLATGVYLLRLSGEGVRPESRRILIVK